MARTRLEFKQARAGVDEYMMNSLTCAPQWHTTRTDDTNVEQKQHVEPDKDRPLSEVCNHAVGMLG